MRRLVAFAAVGALFGVAACAPDPAPAPSRSSSTLPDCDTVPVNSDADPWNDEPCHPTDPVWNQPVVAKDPPPPSGDESCLYCFP